MERDPKQVTEGLFDEEQSFQFDHLLSQTFARANSFVLDFYGVALGSGRLGFLDPLILRRIWLARPCPHNPDFILSTPILK